MIPRFLLFNELNWRFESVTWRKLFWHARISRDTALCIFFMIYKAIEFRVLQQIISIIELYCEISIVRKNSL